MDESEKLPESASANNKAVEKMDNKSDSELSPLRDELRMSEGARLDFMKYKLIAVATIASVALGLSSGGAGKPEMNPLYVLAVIPFVCIYVDALCYHNNLRIFVIAKYLRCNGDPYEGFLDKWGKILKEKSDKTLGFFFEMEDWVLDTSTKAIAVLVMLVGLFSDANLSDCCITIRPLTAQGVIIFLSGLMGLILSYYMKRQYSEKSKMIFSDDCAEIDKKILSGK